MGNLFGSKKSTETAVVTPPAPAPAPTVDVVDPEGLTNARKRADAEAARRGRASLIIPLAGTRAGTTGGINIPS